MPGVRRTHPKGDPSSSTSSMLQILRCSQEKKEQFELNHSFFHSLNSQLKTSDVNSVFLESPSVYLQTSLRGKSCLHKTDDKTLESICVSMLLFSKDTNTAKIIDTSMSI